MVHGLVQWQRHLEGWCPLEMLRIPPSGKFSWSLRLSDIFCILECTHTIIGHVTSAHSISWLKPSGSFLNKGFGGKNRLSGIRDPPPDPPHQGLVTVLGAAHHSDGGLALFLCMCVNPGRETLPFKTLKPQISCLHLRASSSFICIVKVCPSLFTSEGTLETKCLFGYYIVVITGGLISWLQGC